MDNHSDQADRDPKQEDQGHKDGQGYSIHGGHTQPGGLSIAADGMQFVPSVTRLEPGIEQSWTFQITDEQGKVVTDFKETHGERSHLIVVRRDLTGFQHLHPEMDTDGTWSVDLELPKPGIYRAFVDIVVDERPVTLGIDLLVPGTLNVAPRPTSSREAYVDDYEVLMRPDEITAGGGIVLEFEIHHDGETVSELAPYLGACGHLVALRDGDLAYLHIHPLETDSESGVIEFRARFPIRGRYRLFLQARPDGRLITASFDVHVDQ